MISYPIDDPNPKRNFRCVLQTCDNCEYASSNFGTLNHCNQTINYPKKNYVCDCWRERR